VIAPPPRHAPLDVIIDTNVLLSGIFFGGVPGRILVAWQEGRLQLVLSPDILAEYYETAAVLSARYPAITSLDAILSHVTQTATIVDAPALSDGVSADPEDDKFLACAIAAGVPTIVSGDKHLLRLNGWAGLAIVTPRRFVEAYLDSDAGV
jgi:putative PIN family toxin of toxin-antitoxin system